MNGGPAKVVYINTQYVETDALSFKSVVQKLTGKDSVVPGCDPPGGRRRQSPAAGTTKPERSEYYRPAVASVQPEIRGGSNASSNKLAACRNSFLMRNLSFDRLLKDLPPLDDLYGLFCD